MNIFPKRCRSNGYFKTQFPNTLKRLRVKNLTGTVLRPHPRDEDVYVVQWDQLKVPWNLHKDFFRYEDKP